MSKPHYSPPRARTPEMIAKTPSNEHVSREDDDECPNGNSRGSKQIDSKNIASLRSTGVGQGFGQCIGSGWTNSEWTSLFGCSTCHDYLLVVDADAI